MGKITRGKNKGNEIYYKDRYWGCTLFIANPRMGKSALAKTLVVRMVNQTDRPVIIFDTGEWKDDIIHRNYDSPRPECIPRNKFKLHENLGVGLVDFRDPSDWHYFIGATGKTMEVLYQVVTKLAYIHQFDPNTFGEILDYLPKDYIRLNNWNKLYGDRLFLKSPLHEATVRSAISNYAMFKEFLIDPNYPFKRKRIDWKRDFEKYQVNIISLPYEGERERKYNAFVIGTLLKQMAYFLPRLQPLILFEEADFFCGDPLDKSDTPLKSRDQAVVYTTKYGKRGVALGFIMQNEDQLTTDILDNWSSKIYGKADSVSPLYKKWVDALRPNLDLNKREFIYIDKIAGHSVEYFEPDESPCKS